MLVAQLGGWNNISYASQPNVYGNGLLLNEILFYASPECYNRYCIKQTASCL